MTSFIRRMEWSTTLSQVMTIQVPEMAWPLNVKPLENFFGVVPGLQSVPQDLGRQLAPVLFVENRLT